MTGLARRGPFYGPDFFFSGPRGNSRARSALRSRARRKSARAARIAPAAIAPRWAALLGFRLAQRSCCACGGARGSPRLRARPRVGPPAAFRPLCCCCATTKRAKCAKRQNQAVASGFFCSCWFLRLDAARFAWGGVRALLSRAGAEAGVGPPRLRIAAARPKRAFLAAGAMGAAADARRSATFDPTSRPQRRRLMLFSELAVNRLRVALNVNVERNADAQRGAQRRTLNARADAPRQRQRCASSDPTAGGQTVKRQRRPAAGSGLGEF